MVDHNPSSSEKFSIRMSLPSRLAAPASSTETRVALVTGANKGIGLEVSRQLAQLGIMVMIGARDKDRGLRAAETLAAEGLPVKFLRIDVTEQDSIAAAAAQIASDPGRLDILVNNAGILSPGEFHGVDQAGEPIISVPSQVELEVVRSTYVTNVFGPIAVTNALLPLLRQAPAPRIVNVSSRLASFSLTQASRSPNATQNYLNFLAYNSSKAALNYVTLQYAIELSGTRVKVNAADPGHSATDINGHLGDRPPSAAAKIVVRLATLPDDGPSGTFVGEDGPRAW
jgi:NAD(P)-dependent dehydrogenase (short-subunit alcohol dehydrogenase family)